MHTLIVGAPGVGKSTLISRLARELGAPLFGFETKKEDSLSDPQLGSPIYIYEAGQERRRGEENLVGYCLNQKPAPRKEAFDRFAAKLRAPVPAGAVVVLDELGTMKARSEEFCAAVLALLDGDAPVIAAVKHKDTPFLNRVRSHPNCRCFHITAENREQMYDRALAFAKEQLPGAR